MQLLLLQAFNSLGSEPPVGIPGWAMTERFDITAKAPAEGLRGQTIDNESLGLMLRALLADRFAMKWHLE